MKDLKIFIKNKYKNKYNHPVNEKLTLNHPVNEKLTLNSFMINERLSLNKQSLVSPDICSLYKKGVSSFKYKDTEIIIKDSLKNNLGDDSINKLIKIIGIIIDNVTSLYRLTISVPLYTYTHIKFIKISCYSETFEYLDHREDIRVFLGNILIKPDFTGQQCLMGLGVEFKHRNNLDYNPLSLKDEKLVDTLVDFIQPENKKFKIYQ